jgi:ABC-2 type transport system permease protein
MTTTPRSALFRLELADALRSRWVLFTIAAYTLVFGAFVWLGLRESSVLGFTGISRVVLNVSNAVVIVLPLVALVATSQSIVRARTTGLFELLLAQPCKRSDWLFATTAARLAVIAGPLVVILFGTLVFGAIAGEKNLTPIVVVSLTWAFVCVGLLVSSRARTTERATVYGLVAWLAATLLHDLGLIGVLLKWHLSPQVVFGIAAINPIESSRLAILSGIDPELSVLGPVGFWLANSVGSRGALALGVVWPLVLGAIALSLTRRSLDRSDLV